MYSNRRPSASGVSHADASSIPEPKKLTKLLTIKPIQTMEQNEDQELELHDYEVRDGEIIIPEGTTYLQCEDFWGRTDFTRIVIPDSVTTMDEYQFDGCTNLKSVVLSNSVDTIRTLTFRDCTSLESITIPPSVKRIDDFAFVGCTNLKRFFLPKTVEYVGIGLFASCDNLTRIEVEEGSKHFDSRDNCNAIIHKDFEGIRCACKATTFPDSVMEIECYAYYKCTELRQLVIPHSLVRIGSKAFFGCTGLESITLPEKILYFEDWSLETCTNLKTIIVPKGRAQYYCDRFLPEDLHHLVVEQ